MKETIKITVETERVSTELELGLTPERVLQLQNDIAEACKPYIQPSSHLRIDRSMLGQLISLAVPQETIGRVTFTTK